jgi:hypothetical protein
MSLTYSIEIKVNAGHVNFTGSYDACLKVVAGLKLAGTAIIRRGALAGSKIKLNTETVMSFNRAAEMEAESIKLMLSNAEAQHEYDLMTSFGSEKY